MIHEYQGPTGVEYRAECDCGWQSEPRFTVEAAGREFDLHLAEKFPTPTERRMCPGTSDLEHKVAMWVITRIGPDSMHRAERSLRHFEEAAELCQAEGLPVEALHRQIDHVYSRPPGEPSQEAAGCAVTLLGWCAATGNTLASLARHEIQRIYAKSIDEIRGSLTRKLDADLVTAVPPAAARKPGRFDGALEFSTPLTPPALRVEQFNVLRKPGSEVWFHPVVGRTECARFEVDGEAWLAPGDVPVVRLRGRSSYVHLDCLTYEWNDRRPIA